MSNIKQHTDPALQHSHPGPRTAREWARIWEQRAASAPTKTARESALDAMENWQWMAYCDEANAGILPDEEK